MSSFDSLQGLSLSLSSISGALSGTLNSDVQAVSDTSASRANLHSNLNDDSVRYIAVPAPAVKV